MASIVKNAADSIELGIEDIRSHDPKRAITAIRNFYSSMLLLGKECLLSRAPGADPKIFARIATPAGLRQDRRDTL